VVIVKKKEGAAVAIIINRHLSNNVGSNSRKVENHKTDKNHRNNYKCANFNHIS
jgi:hypothetical protein